MCSLLQDSKVMREEVGQEEKQEVSHRTPKNRNFRQNRSMSSATKGEEEERRGRKRRRGGGGGRRRRRSETEIKPAQHPKTPHPADFSEEKEKEKRRKKRKEKKQKSC